MLLTLLINGFRVPMFVNMLITRLGIISPTLARSVHPPTKFCTTMLYFQLRHLASLHPTTIP